MKVFLFCFNGWPYFDVVSQFQIFFVFLFPGLAE